MADNSSNDNLWEWRRRAENKIDKLEESVTNVRLEIRDQVMVVRQDIEKSVDQLQEQLVGLKVRMALVAGGGFILLTLGQLALQWFMRRP